MTQTAPTKPTGNATSAVLLGRSRNRKVETRAAIPGASVKIVAVLSVDVRRNASNMPQKNPTRQALSTE